MSWNVSIVDPKTKEVQNLLERHDLRGGTYALGGTTEASLNITYNYGDFFRKVLPSDGDADAVSLIKTKTRRIAGWKNVIDEQVKGFQQVCDTYAQAFA